MFTQPLSSGGHHRDQRVDDERCSLEIGWRRGETQRRHLDQDEEVVAEYRLDRGGAKIRNLIVFVEFGLGWIVAHANQRSVSPVITGSSGSRANVAVQTEQLRDERHDQGSAALRSPVW